MPHSPEIIEKVAADLVSDYPVECHEYVIEKALPGTRMFPDILIRDLAGEMRCIVEIGYTRPEKLTAYRDEHEIPDVRWYAKDGTLHTELDRVVTIVKTEVRVDTKRPFYVYRVSNLVSCYEEKCFGPGPLAEDFEERDAYSHRFVSSWVVTDYYRAFYPSFCDKCGTTWFADESEAVMVHIEAQEASPRELGLMWGARRELGTWGEAAAAMAEEFQLPVPEYADGYVLDPEELAQERREVEAIVRSVERRRR